MPRFSLFAYGFRPFFLLGGWFAAFVVPAWIFLFAHGSTHPLLFAPQFWHAHEMVYGFVVAAVAGFLLTAVPSWIGGKGFSGWPLMLLTTLWLLGRIAFALEGELPLPVLAVLELAFVPGFIIVLAPPLLRARNRNTPLLLVLAVLWLTDVAFIIGLERQDTSWITQACQLAINLLLLLVTIIAGRIVPSFTGNALRRRGEPVNVQNQPWLERVVPVSMVAVALVDLVLPGSAAAGWLAGLVAVAHAWRLSGWRSLRTHGDSILWVLHLGYAWLPIGFALKALSLLLGIGWAAQWLHALTMGVFGTMILAVMSRVALGHTGRPLTASKSTALAYVLLTIGAITRVFAMGFWPSHYLSLLALAGGLWTAAFGLFLAVYTPILLLPRADGKPG